MEPQWEEHKILIWGKTYPELSSTYFETVCTGGVLEDGRVIRLFPIPFRYLKDERAFSSYQWIKAKIKKSQSDPRPESYKIDPESIEILEVESTDKNGWRKRASHVFKNNSFVYPDFDTLFKAYAEKKVSIGFVKPLTIEKVFIEERDEKDFEAFQRKIEENKEKSKQTSIFGFNTDQFKQLDFLKNRFKVNWKCSNSECNGHSMTILDWGVYVLARKVGYPAALQKMNQVLDISKNDIGFFLGNFRAHPNRFAIGALWYPKKQNPTLFDL